MGVSEKTLKRLWGLAAARCAFAECRYRELVKDASETDDASLVGETCHIVAKKPDGSRGDFPLPVEQRDEYDNLIVLCRVHHKLVDDQPNTYAVKCLLEMKEAHERWVRENLHGFRPIWNVPHGRNPNFTGRGDLLGRLRAALGSGEAAALTQAIHGLGGVGKTQLALEYAYRHRDEYEVVWWVRAEEGATLAAGYAALAGPLGLAERDDPDQGVVVEAVWRWFAGHEGWLLVLDNAPGREEVRGYLPQGGRGHVVITSRNPVWRGVARPLTVQVWERGESVAFLLKRTGQSDEAAAGALAEELGDLPLALEQAGAYMDETGESFAGYLELFRSRRTEVWEDEHAPLDYPYTVATTWSLAMERIGEEAPASADLSNLCAYLGPDDIPEDLVREGAEHLPEGLAEAVADARAMNKAVKALRRYSLVERSGEALTVHRMVQAVVRDRLGEAGRGWAEAAVRVVNGAFPSGNEPQDVRTWPVCGRLLPHALAAAGQAEGLQVAAKATGRLLNQVGLYLHGRAQFGEARAAYERALAIDEAAYGPEHPTVATRVNNLGGVLKDLGDLAGARAAFRRALAIDEAAYGPEHPNVAIRINNLGSVLRALGDLAGARAAHERALAIWEKQLSPEHPNVASAVNNLGLVLRALGDLGGARAHYKRALAIDEAAYGPEHPKVATDVNNLGGVLRDLGDLAGARAAFERALAIDEAAFGPEHPKVARDVNNLGSVLQDRGDLEGARAAYERALAIDEAAFGPEHPKIARDVNNLGSVLRDLGDLAGARAHFERALRICREFLGEDHPHTVLVRKNLESL